MMKHGNSPSKHEDGLERHKPDEQQTPPWAHDILKEVRDMKNSLGAKCDDAMMRSGRASIQKSADETTESLSKPWI